MGGSFDPVTDQDGLLKDRQKCGIDPPQRYILEARDFFFPPNGLLLDRMNAKVEILVNAVEVVCRVLVIVCAAVAVETAQGTNPPRKRRPPV